MFKGSMYHSWNADLCTCHLLWIGNTNIYPHVYSFGILECLCSKIQARFTHTNCPNDGVWKKYIWKGLWVLTSWLLWPWVCLSFVKAIKFHVSFVKMSNRDLRKEQLLDSWETLSLDSHITMTLACYWVREQKQSALVSEMETLLLKS